VTHPSLGLPPRDRTHGLPAAAARIDAMRTRLAARALEIAIDRDPTIRSRYDELGLRRLLRDTLALVDVVVDTIAANDPSPARTFGDAIPPAYRRRRVPMDDLIGLCEGIRHAGSAMIDLADRAGVDLAVDTLIERFRWHRRLAGDGRKRNRILAAIYKGA
jgi:hypothetical protein